MEEIREKLLKQAELIKTVKELLAKVEVLSVKVTVLENA